MEMVVNVSVIKSSVDCAADVAKDCVAIDSIELCC